MGQVVVPADIQVLCYFKAVNWIKSFRKLLCIYARKWTSQEKLHGWSAVFSLAMLVLINEVIYVYIQVIMLCKLMSVSGGECIAVAWNRTMSVESSVISAYQATTTCGLTTQQAVIHVSALISLTSVSAPPGDAIRYHNKAWYHYSYIQMNEWMNLYCLLKRW